MHVQVRGRCRKACSHSLPPQLSPSPFHHPSPPSIRSTHCSTSASAYCTSGTGSGRSSSVSWILVSARRHASTMSLKLFHMGLCPRNKLRARSSDLASGSRMRYCTPGYVRGGEGNSGYTTTPTGMVAFTVTPMACASSVAWDRFCMLETRKWVTHGASAAHEARRRSPVLRWRSRWRCVVRGKIGRNDSLTSESGRQAEGARAGLGSSRPMNPASRRSGNVCSKMKYWSSSRGPLGAVRTTRDHRSGAMSRTSSCAARSPGDGDTGGLATNGRPRRIRSNTACMASSSCAVSISGGTYGMLTSVRYR